MFLSVSSTTLFIALLMGILPAVFWLWFWRHEDRLHPEPRGLILLAFLAGMLATTLAYPIEKSIATHVVANDLVLLFLWAVTEEVLKFGAIYIVALRSKYFDEPIDAVMYFVTIALGFAALENAMFLFNPIDAGDSLATILLGNFRFIGATLLHVAASGIVGVMLAFAFYDTRENRRKASMIGLALAIVLHTLFNFSIIMTEGAYLYQIFVALWVFIVAIILLCERIKAIPARSHVLYPNTGIVITIPHKPIV
jgi:RsiW-degrading membrane proteinase PrsW (M82 family)